MDRAEKDKLASKKDPFFLLKQYCIFKEFDYTKLTSFTHLVLGEG